jgi:glycosyltransferase involved in cell wall biosynthesis
MREPTGPPQGRTPERAARRCIGDPGPGGARLLLVDDNKVNRLLLTRTLENHVVAGADQVVTICQGLKDDLVSRGNDPARIAIAPNGVDLSLFGEPLPRDCAFAAELGLGEGPVIGFIGSFYDYEGLDDLIAAMPMRKLSR